MEKETAAEAESRRHQARHLSELPTRSVDIYTYDE